jgi:hypothetical protein
MANEKPKKPRAEKYEDKVKTDKTFIDLINMAVNTKPKDSEPKK